MSVEYQNSILWRGQDPSKSKFKPKFDGTKQVARYRAGIAPKWVEDDESAPTGKGQDLRQAARRKRAEAAQAVEKKEDVAISRLKRLSASAVLESGSERLLRHRVLHEARVLEAAQEDEEMKEKEEEEADNRLLSRRAKEELDDKRMPGLAELKYDDMGMSDEEPNDVQALRRERTREVALLRRKQEEDMLLKEEQEEVLEDELVDESEYESESEDDPRRQIMMKPVFVNKNQRETVREKELLEKEEEEKVLKAKEKLKERKADSKALLIDTIKSAEDAENEHEAELSEPEMIDDNDENNEAEEYEFWKIRELKRIKRDKEERFDRQKEIEFILKRRGMTDEERAADDARLDAINPKSEEAKQFNFLQKYYHKGGFFQDKATTGEEPLYLRDYHEPLEEEKFDKQLLPQAMQLRRGQFGKKGQVKHTHLTESDTTDMSAAWAQHTKQIQKYQEKMASASGINKFDRPTLAAKK